MMQITGINAVVTQANNIVADIIPDLAEYVPLIINSVQLLATIVTVALLAGLGRKPLILLGNLSLAFIDIALGVLFLFKDWAPGGYIILTLLILYMAVYGLSLGPIIWLYVPEILPSKSVPLATMMNWLSSSICVILTPIVTEANGNNPFPVFFFFGGITLLLFIANCFLVVETKGLSTR
jgi:MFS transporter, SP family, arabinose:H+ symporter